MRGWHFIRPDLEDDWIRLAWDWSVLAHWLAVWS